MRRSMADRFRARPRSGRIAIAFAALLALALVAALAATVGRVAPADAAGPTPFPPVADSYVQADQAGTNYGAQTQIRADGMPVVRAYLRFNPQGLSGAVTNAVLRVRANSGQPETGYSVQGVASVTWGETSITFSNAPPVSSPAYGPTGAFAAGTWNEVDVTPLVTGNGLVSMAITSTAPTAMSLASRESGANAPQLVITTAPADPPPATPTGLQAAANGDEAVDVSWTAPPDADVTGYAIYRDGASAPTGSTVGAAATTFTDTGLVPGTTHTYAVDAVDAAGGRSARSAAVSVSTLNTIAPAAPANLVATASGTTGIGLTWSAPADRDLSSYRILRDGEQVGTRSASGPTSFADTGLTPDTAYSYTVHAIDTAGLVSDGSNAAGARTEAPDVTPPAAPTGLVATANGTSEIDLVWTAPADPDVAGYKIFRDSVEAGTANGAGATSFADRGLLADTPYTYTVVAVDGAGNPSGPSNAASARTAALDVTPPAAPTGLVATANGTSRIDLAWSAPADPDVAGYRIFRGGSQAGATTGAGATSFADSGLLADTPYTYTVVAVDGAGNLSGPSNAASARTAAAPPPPPAERTFTPVADSYVQADQAGVNYGTQTQLRADATPVVRAYLRFNPQQLAGTVTKAVLRLRTNSTHPKGWLASGVADTTWGETTITSNNAPPLSSPAYGPTGSFAANAWTEVTVTPLVKGNGLVSFALTTTDPTAMSLASRESGANAPQLVVTTGGAASDTTPPAAPTGLVATANGPNRIDLAWSGPADADVAGYRVYRGGGQVGATTGASARTFSETGLSPDTLYTYTVEAIDGSGNRSQPSAPASARTAAGGSDPVIAAAGDIACGNGYIGNYCVQMQTSDQIIQMNPVAVLALGDIQYEQGAYADYMDSSSNVKVGYDKSWGRFKAKTYPAIGNHEYITPVADNYLKYWSDYAARRGPWSALAGNPVKGYYSFDVGAWHLISFNSNCGQLSCAKGGEQETWIKNDLAAHPNRCTLAFAHHPFRNSFFETSKEPRWPDIFQTFYDAGVDLVLVGHAHNYERTAPMNPAGGIDRTRGVRTFVVGTGGKGPAGASATPQPFSEAHAGGTLGVMKLTLHPAGYDWDFRGLPSTPFVDMGAGSCH